MKKITLLLIMGYLLTGCRQEGRDAISSTPSQDEHTTSAFPAMPSVDKAVYSTMKKTCAERWQLENMKLNTLKVVPHGDEYTIECDGTVDGELWHCVIRANASGQWINDGRRKENP